jgi:DNA ligase-1
MNSFKPMLASDLDGAVQLVHYPALVSPKLDGIRCVIRDGKAVTRSGKPVPNRHVRTWLEANCPEGFDGELMLPPPATFQDCTSAFMSHEAVPPAVWFFAVFDVVIDGVRFDDRQKRLREMVLNCDARRVQQVPHITVRSQEELADFEEHCIAAAYEGVMIRSAKGLYKYGRSTNGDMWKLKRFADAEARVVGFEELAHKDGSAGNMLGALKVRDVSSGVEFSIGTGFDQATRRTVWAERDFYVGRIVKYKSFRVCGVVEKPRFPVFLGWRAVEDMDTLPPAELPENVISLCARRKQLARSKRGSIPRVSIISGGKKYVLNADGTKTVTALEKATGPRDEAEARLWSFLDSLQPGEVGFVGLDG